MSVIGLSRMLVKIVEDEREKGVQKDKFKIIKWSEVGLPFVSRVSVKQQIARELLGIGDILEIF